jgi:HEAT repeat protein
MEGDDQSRLEGWLARLGGPGFKGRQDRDQAVAEMRTAGADKLYPLLVPMLADPDAEARCKGCEAVLRLDARRGVELVLPLLRDADVTVRWFACGCLWELGDDRAVAPLLAILQTDEDAQVRGVAARALGRLGGPAVIPALLATMASDHEQDLHGHSPSGCAATALDDILDTEETRIRVSATLCKMRPGEPDLGRLRRLAEALYQQWSHARDEPPASDGTANVKPRLP